MKYTLIKTQKGKRFLYTVTDENGNIISERISARDYVACTANGEFYFSHLDLIGKGDHGRAIRCFYIQNQDKYTSKQMHTIYVERIKELESIAYLKEKGAVS